VYFEYRRRRRVRPTRRRKRIVDRIRRRRGRVSVGDVETMYSTVVGEGRRVRRWGGVVSMVGASFGMLWCEQWRRDEVEVHLDGTQGELIDKKKFQSAVAQHM
jgi:hypothetical protein